ncbi:MAG: type IV pilus assembly protein PilM, partial [bacterium]
MGEKERDVATNRLLEIIRGGKGEVATPPSLPKTEPQPESHPEPGESLLKRVKAVRPPEEELTQPQVVVETLLPPSPPQPPPKETLPEEPPQVLISLMPLPQRLLLRLRNWATKKKKEQPLLPEPQIEKKLAREKKPLIKPSKGKIKGVKVGKGIVAVDIGSASIKVVELVRKGGMLYIGDLVYRQIPMGMRRSSTGIAILVVKTLKEIFSSKRLSRAEIRLVLPDRAAIARRVSVPGGAAKELLGAIKFQLKKDIPFPIETIKLSYQGWKRGIKGKQDLDVLAVDGKVLEEMSNWAAEAELIPVQFTAPVVCYPELIKDYTDLSSEKGILVVDIGATKTTVTVVYEGKVQFSRTIMTGGDDFTSALIGASISPDGGELNEIRAEQFKREVGIPPESLPRAMKVAILLRPIVERISNEINRVVELFRRDKEIGEVSKVLLCGGGALLKRLPELIAQNVGLEVELANPLNRLQCTGPRAQEVMEIASEWGPAFIPALAVALTDRRHFNILPESIKAEIRLKKTRNMVAPIGLGMISFLILLYAELFIRHSLVQDRYQSLTGELKDLNQIRAQYLATNAELQSVQSQWEIKRGEYETLKEEDPAILGYLKALSNVIPPNIYLTALYTDYKVPPAQPQSQSSADTAKGLSKLPVVTGLNKIRD